MFRTKLAGERNFLAPDVSHLFFRSTRFTLECVQNCRLIPRCGRVCRLSCTSQSSPRSLALRSPAIPSRGAPSESCGAGRLTCAGSRGDRSGTGGTPGWKAQVRSGLAVFSLCLTDFGLHSQPFP